MLSTPVLLIIFNRPDLTGQVFEAIRQARPAQLFIAADGPRNEDEVTRTEEARKVTENIDWPCKVERYYTPDNQGCKIGPYNAISWAFDQVEELIILEDDCLPHHDFFTFCESMLIRYRNNPQIMHISGDCFLPFTLNDSYYFTNYTHVWGWATFRHAWQKMDLKMTHWKVDRRTDFLLKRLRKSYAINYWQELFDSVAFGDPKIWDYQWTYSVWKAGGIAICPTTNLISNIGFGKDATHTMSSESTFSKIPVDSILAISHPEEIAINVKADSWVRDYVYTPKPVTIFSKAKQKIRSWVR